MKAVGIICEYNPFHNGHLYHLKKVKELFPNHLIILVLNGYFLERGEISILAKKDKVHLALLHGIDIVLELPMVFGTQSADIFARTSIKMLEEMQCEYVVFGSESNNLTNLCQVVDYTLNNKEKYNQDVKSYLEEGINYPTSTAKALNVPYTFKSNDLLAISYIKAIKENNYQIKPYSIKRTNDYLDTLNDDFIVSASNIRNKLEQNIDIKKYVPSSTLKFMQNISLDNYFPYLKYKIITDDNLNAYLDVDEGIENRLKKVILKVTSTTELIENLKTKRYTYNRLRRMIVHILIGLTKEDKKKITLDYIKVLGFNKKGKNYLNKIKKDISYPLTSFKNSLTYQYELKTALIYDLISNSHNYEFELKNHPLINLD